METSINSIKKFMPILVKQVADWFEIDVTIRLFGVKVFSFTWPPKSDSTNNSENS